MRSSSICVLGGRRGQHTRATREPLAVVAKRQAKTAVGRHLKGPLRHSQENNRPPKKSAHPPQVRVEKRGLAFTILVATVREGGWRTRRAARDALQRSTPLKGQVCQTASPCYRARREPGRAPCRPPPRSRLLDSARCSCQQCCCAALCTDSASHAVLLHIRHSA